jgi:hypothetical protein
MHDENDQVDRDEMMQEMIDDDATFDPDRDIVEYDPAVIGADELYEVRMEAENLGAVALAARIEIERRNAIADEQYEPQFGQHELLDVAMMLMSAKQLRHQSGEMDRFERIRDLASAFLDGFSVDGEDIDIEMVEEQPTLDDVGVDDGE